MLQETFLMQFKIMNNIFIIIVTVSRQEDIVYFKWLL